MTTTTGNLIRFVELNIVMYLELGGFITTETCITSTLKVLFSAQDRGPFWFSYILNEILQYIEIRNEFKV